MDYPELLAAYDVLEAKYATIQAARNELDAIVSENITRRGEVEQHLLNVATGKAPPLTAQDCRILALRLGTPKKYWKPHTFGQQETLQ